MKIKSIFVKLITVLFFIATMIPAIATYADNNTIIMLNPSRDYKKGEVIEVTVGISSADGSYLKSANCGFGYNGSTMKLLTETESPDHFYVESNVPSKWLYYSMKFEMLRDGKMYFIAGAYSGDGVIKAIRGDGSRIDLERASVVYKIGTGIFTKVSDCNLSDLSISDNTGNVIEMNRAFDKNITEYWFDVNGSVDFLNITGIAENPNDRVIIPDLYINTGKNVKEVIVEASDRTQKKYILNITRPDQPATVNDIEIYDKNKKLIPYEFSKETNEYYIEVENTVDEITFRGIGNEFVSFTYPENDELIIGYNNKTIVAKTDTNEKIYSYNIFRKASKLQMISLIGELSDDTVLTLDKEFSPDVKEYSANVKADVQKIKFIYTLGDKSDRILENREYDLKEGINTCTLTVTDNVNENKYTIVILKDAYVKVTEPDEEPNKPFHNDKDITRFEFKDIKGIFIIGFIVIIIILIITTIQLHKRMADYKLSDEGIANKEEKERKKRLKEKRKERAKTDNK